MDAEYKRRMAEKYKKAPEAEKPHIKECPDCHKPEFQSDICPETGIYHPKEGRVVFGVRVESNIITGQQLQKLLSTVRVAWQKSRTEKVLIDEDSINMFQSFMLSRRWAFQRYGIMYGTSKDGVVEVHSIYEPEQEGSKDDFKVLKDSRLERVDNMAEMFGLKRVGILVGHGERNREEIVLSAKELLTCVKDQSRFGDHCVIVTVCPNAETRQTEVEAWQASEQAVTLFRGGFLSPSSTKLGYVHSTIPLEVAEVKTDGKGGQSMVCKEPSVEVDTRWMLSYTAIESFTSNILTNRFIRISRPGEAPPAIQNLKMYMNDPKRSRQTFLQKISDFHVLIYLMDILDPKHDMPLVVAAIISQEESGMHGIRELIEAYLQH
eukprot:PhF_6_TR8485/c0_g1_i1/m.13274/K14015/NPLOC4, NPL4; nuclear protein localization protein 4 homolog